MQLDAAANLKQARKPEAHHPKRTSLDWCAQRASTSANSLPGQAIATIYANESLEVRLPVADRQLAFLNIPPTQRGELPTEFQPSVRLTTNYAGQLLEWTGTIVRTEAENRSLQPHGPIGAHRKRQR